MSGLPAFVLEGTTRRRACGVGEIVLAEPCVSRTPRRISRRDPSRLQVDGSRSCRLSGGRSWEVEINLRPFSSLI
ncbi:hypothetical protein L484_021472 [Morus notabilis]|uniref:Uncharacterized protein n=1 Tax=Morus notabilis TaxID=981085 RepID=W9SK23_9ROSA|nr:hypothetical protein L484_021472 [Morus notabilis]